MIAYILRRILLIIPTMLGIMLVTFVIVQFAPGGPVERLIAQLTGTDPGATATFSGGGGDFARQARPGGRSGRPGGAVEISRRAGARPEFIKSLEKQFGFDKPAYERFFLMVKNYLLFDFGESYFRDTSVLSLIAEKMPVSISLGLWMTLLSYCHLDPARHPQGGAATASRFDVWTSTVIVIGYAIPGFLVAVFLDRAVRRRVVPANLPLARARVRQLVGAALVSEDRRLFLASRAADDRDGALGLRHARRSSPRTRSSRRSGSNM